jgi:DNA-binding CsgD family transcriptional regulator
MCTSGVGTKPKNAPASSPAATKEVDSQSDENLLRLVEGDLGSDQSVLRQKLLVTEREAEVLLWIARGKSNRDIADILHLSPRTVNKHLEQIYAKLGVENHTSAAALAVRALGVT